LTPPANNPADFKPAYPGSGVPVFEKAKLFSRLKDSLDAFQKDIKANPKLSEQDIQTVYIEGVGIGKGILMALGWPVDMLNTVYNRNQSQDRSRRPDGILRNPDNGQDIIAMDAKRPDELPTFTRDEALDLPKLMQKQSNLYKKINYCSNNGPRWLLLSCGDRLYLYDSLVKRWVIALNSAQEMLSDQGRDLLELISWPALTEENATGLKNLAREYDRKLLDDLEDEMQKWRDNLATMLYRRNYDNPILLTGGEFDPEKLQRSVQRILNRLILIQILQDKGFINDLIRNDLDVLQSVLAASQTFQNVIGFSALAQSVWEILRDIDAYTYQTKNHLLFPYKLDDNKVRLISTQDMLTLYPKAWLYLNHPINKEILENRDSGRFRGKENWYCYSYPRSMTLLSLSKLVLPDVAGRAEFAYDREGRYIIDTAYGIRLLEEGKLSLQALTAILNSSLLTFFLRQTGTDLRGGYFRMKTAYLNPFPMPNFSFTTASEERNSKLDHIRESYKNNGPQAITGLAAAELKIGKTDVVHDILAFLAEQMPEIKRQRQEVVTDFSRYVEQYPTGPNLGAWVNSLSLTKRKVFNGGIGPKKGLELRKLEALSASPSPELTVGPGEKVLAFWLTARENGSKQDQREEVCRAVLSSDQADLIRCFLPKEGSL
jgi:hypothetical protein